MWKLRSDAATAYPFLSFPAFSDPGKVVELGAMRDKKSDWLGQGSACSLYDGGVKVQVAANLPSRTSFAVKQAQRHQNAVTRNSSKVRAKC